MSPEEAAAYLPIAIKQEVARINRQVDVRLVSGANILRNTAIDKTLKGQKSPSAPGSLPGIKSGLFRITWSTFYTGGGGSGTFGIASGRKYAGYLEHGTRKMAARPFVDRIQADAKQEIIAKFQEIGG